MKYQALIKDLKPKEKPVKRTPKQNKTALEPLVAVPEGLLGIIEGLYDEACLVDIDDRSIEADGFHPSSLGVPHGGCMRRQIYLLRGVQKQSNVGPQLKRIFETGHSTHRRIQRTITRLLGSKDFEVISFADEASVEANDPPIRGHADGLWVIKYQGKLIRILIEIKSCNEAAFNARVSFGKEKSDHFDQANIYGVILECDYILFIYECKNNSDDIMFLSAVSKASAQIIIDKWKRTWDIFNKGEQVIRPHKATTAICRGCDMNKICWSSDELGVELVK